MPRYMLDTDICSYLMKRSSPALLRKVRHVPIGDVCMSVISNAELLYGVELSPRRAENEAALSLLLQHVEVLDFRDEAAAHYARIRADLKRDGAIIGANDLLIAAHARSLGFVLVTNNTREFARVPGLKFENWTLAGKRS
jgi:tRNA(fMet)-specific endonuclease VapC